MKFYFSTFIIVILFFGCKQDKADAPDNKEARDQIVSADEINKKIQEGRDIYYQDAVITGDIDFTLSPDKNVETPSILRYNQKSGIVFSNCTFRGEIIASRTDGDKNKYLYFDRNLSFLNCTFQSKVNFTESRFDDLALFRENIYQDTVQFRGAVFHFKKNSFYNSRFMAFTDFSRTRFKGESSFLKSEFHGNLLFQSAVFYEQVNFGNIHLHKKSDMSLNSYRANVNFSYAAFDAPCSFNESTYFGKVLLNDIKAKEKLNMENSLYLTRPETNLPSLKDIISFKNSRLYMSTEF